MEYVIHTANCLNYGMKRSEQADWHSCVISWGRHSSYHNYIALSPQCHSVDCQRTTKADGSYKRRYLVERVVSVEAVVLNETKHSDLVLVFAVLGILHDVPRLREAGRGGRGGRERGREGEGGEGEEGERGGRGRKN